MPIQVATKPLRLSTWIENAKNPSNAVHGHPEYIQLLFKKKYTTVLRNHYRILGVLKNLWSISLLCICTEVVCQCQIQTNCQHAFIYKTRNYYHTTKFPKRLRNCTWTLHLPMPRQSIHSVKIISNLTFTGKRKGKRKKKQTRSLNSTSH